jgi:hypothetical protein
MNGVNPKDIAIAMLAFLVVSFLSKLAFLAIFANLITNLFSVESNAPIYISMVTVILFTGLAIGKLINSRIHTNPFTHTLIIAAIAGIYRALYPDFDPLPYFFVVLFSLLNFSAILLGAYVTASK